MTVLEKRKQKKYAKWELRDSTLQGYIEKASALGVDRLIRRLPNAGAAATEQRKNANRRIRAYLNQLWNIVEASGEEGSYLFMLLDADGCQIMTRGDRILRAEVMEAGITDGAVWRIDAAGPTALSIGMEENRSVTSEGAQNYARILTPYILCFAPLHIIRSNHRRRLGGIALLARAGADRKHCQMTLGLIAADLTIHYESSMMISQGYQARKKGMAWLDINPRSGEIALVHHNDAFFDVLELPHRQEDLYFTPLVSYIDPLPYNGQFWGILNKMQEVHEKDLQLIVGGRRRNVIVSTTVDVDEVLDTRSILLQIDTRSRMTKAISEKTANNAIMTFDTIIGSCPAMESAIRKAKILAGTESNVLLYGESGVGKDVFAQAIHNASSRRDKPFVAVNCGALPRELIESELFGYEGGAFTGAKKQGNIGKFELANGGTLFLDEVGELPLDLQATLLRAVEQKSFMRVGSNQLVEVDVKIISATNANIPQMIREKRFRMDLFYRLGTMYLQIPPLRARGLDAVELAEHFIASICSRIRRRIPKTIAPDAQDLLCSLPWHGNVRELQNLMECLVQLYPDEVISRQQVLESLSPLGAGTGGAGAYPEMNPGGSPVYPEMSPGPATAYPEMSPGRLPEADPFGTLAGNYAMPAPGGYFETQTAGYMSAAPDGRLEAEVGGLLKKDQPGPSGRDEKGLLTREEIQRALDACGGNRSKAARYLGIARKTLYRNMERLGM